MSTNSSNNPVKIWERHQLIDETSAKHLNKKADEALVESMQAQKLLGKEFIGLKIDVNRGEVEGVIASTPELQILGDTLKVFFSEPGQEFTLLKKAAREMRGETSTL